MNHKLLYLAGFLGLLVIGWYLTSLLFGFSPYPMVTSLRAVLLAAAVWLSGAALAWAGRRLTAQTWLVGGMLALAALVLIPPIFHEHEPNAPKIFEDFALLGFLLPQMLPCLALVVAALLLSTGLKQFSSRVNQKPEPSEDTSENSQPGMRVGAIALALGVMVLAASLYHLYWLFVWDSTYDPLDVIFLMVPTLAALCSAALLAALLAGRQKLSGLLYAILVPALMIVVFRSAKQVDYRRLTEARAERISQALERYHARQGSYPDRLSQLSPWTTLSIPGPVILYGQDWCYQGTRDSYRLGFVDREHWSSPELLSQVYKSQGPNPGEGELCETAIAVMKARYPDFYGIGYR